MLWRQGGDFSGKVFLFVADGPKCCLEAFFYPDFAIQYGGYRGRHLFWAQGFTDVAQRSVTEGAVYGGLFFVTRHNHHRQTGKTLTNRHQAKQVHAARHVQVEQK